jgi:hypothetical protein
MINVSDGNLPQRGYRQAERNVGKKIVLNVRGVGLSLNQLEEKNVRLLIGIADKALMQCD